MIGILVLAGVAIAAIAYAHIVGRRSDRKVEALKNLYQDELKKQTKIAHDLRMQYEGRKVIRLTAEAWGAGATKEATDDVLTAARTFVEVDRMNDRLRATIRVATIDDGTD